MRLSRRIMCSDIGTDSWCFVLCHLPRNLLLMHHFHSIRLINTKVIDNAQCCGKLGGKGTFRILRVRIEKKSAINCYSLLTKQFFKFLFFLIWSLHTTRGSKAQPWDQELCALSTEPAKDPQEGNLIIPITIFWIHILFDPRVNSIGLFAQKPNDTCALMFIVLFVTVENWQHPKWVLMENWLNYRTSILWNTYNC